MQFRLPPSCSITAFASLTCALGCGAGEPDVRPGANAGSDPGAAALNGERALEFPDLARLFPARDVPVTEAILANLRFREPAADGWESEDWASAIEAGLERILLARLAGLDLPAELVGVPATELAALDLDLPGERGGARPGEHQVEVEVTRCERSKGQRVLAECAVSIVRTIQNELGAAEIGILAPGPGWEAHSGPFQRTLSFSSSWELAGASLRLVELRELEAPDGARAAAADRPLFADRTLYAFGRDPGFQEELLRDPEAYYFHSDRLTGYDLLGNHGLAVGDVDDDGLEDLYVCMQRGLPCRLYLATADGRTREAALERKVAFLDGPRSALILDLDGDARRDLACAIGAEVVLCWNEGPTFAPQRGILRPSSPEDIYGLSAGDPDQDGDLDLYACRYSSQGVMRGDPTPYHDAVNGAPNVYWRNLGGRRFEDATAAVGFDQNNHKFSFAAMWEDFDDDGDSDLYVTNDFGRNHYYRNDGGRFSDVATEIGAEDMAASMGGTSGDVDADGDLDLYVSNVYAPEGMRITSAGARFLRGRPPELLLRYQRHARGNTLLQNRGDGTFADASLPSGALRGGWAWGARLCDLDNDRDLDLFVPNGFVTGRADREMDEFFWRFVIARSPAGAVATDEYRDAWKTAQYLAFERGEGWNGGEREVLLLNDGRGRFVEATGLAGVDVREDGRALAALDWDRDGFLDLVLKSRDAPRLRLLCNRGSARGRDSWLVLELVGSGANRDAVGAQVRVFLKGAVLRRSVVAGDAFLAQSSRRLHYGLGPDAAVEAVEVRWPDGEVQRFQGGIEPAHAYRITRGEAQPTAIEWAPVAAVADDPLGPPVELEGSVGRIVLCEKLPMAPAPLPGFEAAERRVRDLQGRPLLVTFWRSDDAPSTEQIERLARERKRMASAGLRFVPLSIDQGYGLSRARERAVKLGLAEDAGFVDGWALQAFELLLMEVFHRNDNSPLPTSLLLDRAGQLCIVYHGPVEVAELLDDVAVLEQMEPGNPGCARLQRGLWHQRPRRDLGLLAEVLGQLAYADLSEFYREAAQRRR